MLPPASALVGRVVGTNGDKEDYIPFDLENDAVATPFAVRL